MTKNRIVLIGAGSMLYSKELASSLMSSAGLCESELVLFDIDHERLDLVYRYISSLVGLRRSPMTVHRETDRDRALEGADFVVVAVAIGGLAAKKLDVDIAADHGIMQIKADTTGPAGLFRALRSIPFFLQLAADMERLCPSAYLLNVTNPLAAITGAVTQNSSIRTLGICGAVTEMGWDFARKLGVERERLRIVSAGVNHFTWLTGLYLDGTQRMDLVRDVLVPAFGDLPVTGELFGAFGMFPIPGYKYASEFFAGYGAAAGFTPFDAQGAAAAFSAQIAAVTAELDGARPFRLDHESADSAILASVMESISLDMPGVYSINRPNTQIDSLPRGAIVEGPVYVRGEQIAPLWPGDFTDSVKSLLEGAARRQQLTIDAAVAGDGRMVVEALMADPLVPSVRVAIELTDDYLRREADFLPQFGMGGGDA